MILKGTTRTVWLTKKHAIKVPRLHAWENFLCGLLANLQERKFGRSELAGFCPVKTADPLGLLVVMPRCEPLSDSEWKAFDVDAFRNRDTHYVCAEDKQDSFGHLEGQIVAIDFG